MSQNLIHEQCFEHSGHECRIKELEKETDSIKGKLDRIYWVLLVLAGEGVVSLGSIGVMM